MLCVIVFYKLHSWFQMTSVCGHVMGLDFHPRYNNWDRVDPVSNQVTIRRQSDDVIQ